MKIALIGFGNFGQFLGQRFKKYGYEVMATSRSDYTEKAKELGIQFYTSADELANQYPDCYVLATSIVSLETVVKSLPLEQMKGALFVDVLSVKAYPKEFLKRILPNECDILCTHPMFGPESGKGSWDDLAFVFDKVRIRNEQRAKEYLDIFEKEGCSMVPMTCEQHDELSASSQFLTHTTGRMLSKLYLRPSPIDTEGYKNLLSLVENTCEDSFDLYFGLFQYNESSRAELSKIEQAFISLKNQLFDKAREMRKMVIIGVQGGEGSFNHAAALELAEKYQYKNVEYRYLITSEAVLEALNKGEVDYGVFAIENSGSGTVIPSVFSMSRYPHDIIEIHEMRLTQCLLGRPGQEIEDAKKIITHPQAIKQCEKTLKEKYSHLTWDYLSDDYDTAECAKHLSLGEYPEDTVVIASEIAAQKYGLEIIHKGLNDDADNFTSFIFCQRRQ